MKEKSQNFGICVGPAALPNSDEALLSSVAREPSYFFPGSIGLLVIGCGAFCSTSVAELSIQKEVADYWVETRCM